MKQKIIQQIVEAKIIAIIRVAQQSKVAGIIENVVEAGIRVLEITSNTPDYCNEMKSAKKKFPNAIVGAGTILNGRLAREAIDHGAEFLVTPNVNQDVIRLAHESDIPVLMGVMTSSEIAAALEYGADFLKLFPASTLGPEYLKAVRGPFNDAKFFAVGGVSVSNASTWIEAGACGIGVGGSLTSLDIHSLRSQVADLIKQINKQ